MVQNTNTHQRVTTANSSLQIFQNFNLIKVKNIATCLDEIWSKNYISLLPTFISERGYNYSENTAEKEILITGINPSYRGVDDHCKSYRFQDLLHASKWTTIGATSKRCCIRQQNKLI